MIYILGTIMAQIQIANRYVCVVRYLSCAIHTFHIVHMCAACARFVFVMSAGCEVWCVGCILC